MNRKATREMTLRRAFKESVGSSQGRRRQANAALGYMGIEFQYQQQSASTIVRQILVITEPPAGRASPEVLAQDALAPDIGAPVQPLIMDYSKPAQGTFADVSDYDSNRISSRGGQKIYWNLIGNCKKRSGICGCAVAEEMRYTHVNKMQALRYHLKFDFIGHRASSCEIMLCENCTALLSQTSIQFIVVTRSIHASCILALQCLFAAVRTNTPAQ